MPIARAIIHYGIITEKEFKEYGTDYCDWYLTYSEAEKAAIEMTERLTEETILLFGFLNGDLTFEEHYKYNPVYGVQMEEIPL